MTFFYNTTF